MTEIRIRIFGAVLILVLMTFGDAGAREIPSGQESRITHSDGRRTEHISGRRGSLRRKPLPERDSR